MKDKSVLDQLQERYESGELTKAERDIWSSYYIEGHRLGVDEREEEGKEESKLDAGFTQGRLSAFAEVADWAAEIVTEEEAARVAYKKTCTGVVSGITTARRHGRIRTFTEVADWSTKRGEVALKTIVDKGV